MPGFKDGNLTVYPYGDDDAPAGAGKGAQEFRKILESLGPGEKFVDPLFPATAQSFGQLKFEYEEGDPMNIKWFRPTEIAKTLFKAAPIFSGPFDEFCVNQGMVGDCWFLAVLADVATVPECVDTLIPKDNAEIGFDKGIFHFRFWCRGKWVDVVVDDQLPCLIDDDGETSTLFTKPTPNGGFWAALMEKAYAKMYGNYGCIDSGYPTDAMKDFTGGFVRCYEREREKDTDWKTVITEGKSNNAIMSVGTVSDCPEGKLAPEPDDPDNPGPENVSSEGIVLGHEYSLLDIQEVRDITDSNKVHTLLKLRNPWGNDTEWNGAFSDSDTIWNCVTPNLRANPDQVRPDGEFWIPLENWLPYLDDLDICLWSAKYRGDSSVINKGFVLFQTSANFPDTNHGDMKSAEDFEGKPGYYVHLRPLDPNSGKTGKNGLKNNCHLAVNLMYQNYVKSGDNPHIPSMGFHLLWAPGEQSPNEKEYFKRVTLNERHMNPAGKSRDINVTLHLPAGTALVIPWIQEASDEPTPYLLRLGTEGELHEYSP